MNAKATKSPADAKMHILVKDKDGQLETVDKSKRVIGEDGRKVKTTFTITYDGKTYVAEDATFDFTGCSEEEVILLAARTAIIATQTRAKTAMRSNVTDASLAKHWKHIDVKKDVVESERKGKSPLEKAATQLSKMSAEDKAALLELLKG